MAFLEKGLDKTGLARLWANITALVETKTNEAKKYTDDNKYNDSALAARVKNVEDHKAPVENPSFTGDGITVANGLAITSTHANKNKSHFSMNRLGGSIRGAYSSTLGYAGTASGESSHAEGNQTYATGFFSHSEGAETKAEGVASHAEGAMTHAKGDKSHAEGTGCTAVGDSAHAEGSGSMATNTCSHAEGQQTKAQGVGAHAEGGATDAQGQHSHAEGQSTTAVGEGSHTEGVGTIAYERAAHAEGLHTRAFYGQHASGKFNTFRAGPTGEADTTGTLFAVGCGTSDSARVNAFRIDANGKSYFKQAITTSGADFAEFFEWADGNPNNEDRRGKFVTLEGDKIRLANDADDYIGIVSAEGAFIGNAAEEEWQGKYVTDIFGTKETQQIEMPEQVNSETGEVIEKAYIATQFVINPKYDPNSEYIPRAERKEWAMVGLVGQLVVVDDGTSIICGRTKPGADGVGTFSSDGTGYRVMRRLDETHIQALVK